MQFYLKASILLLFFTGHSPALASPWAQGFTPTWAYDCQTKEAQRTEHTLEDYNKCDSKGYAGYEDDRIPYMALNFEGGYDVAPQITSVHVVVTDIKLDRNIPATAICESEMCYRVLIFINGDSQTGDHVATWVTSPGRPWNDGSGGNYTPESYEVLLSGRQPNQNSYGHFKLQRDHEMGLGGIVTNKFPGYYVMDHYVNTDDENMGWATCYHFGICFHSSFTVNGNAASHGCTRLKYLEAKRLNFLARHVQRNFTVETRFTERETLTPEERNAVSHLELAGLQLEETGRLYDQAENGATQEERDRAQRELTNRAMESGGLY